MKKSGTGLKALLCVLLLLLSALSFTAPAESGDTRWADAADEIDRFLDLGF